MRIFTFAEKTNRLRPGVTRLAGVRRASLGFGQLRGAATMSENEKEKAERAEAQILRDVFEGMKGRQPASDQELSEWLGSSEGKEATMFEPTSLSRWGETGRS